MIRTPAAVLCQVLAVAALVAATPSRAQEEAGVKFSGGHAFRAFDCRGGDAVISGDSNRLKLTDCSRLTLSGARNQISVTLSSPGDIVVSGSKNAVRYRSPDDGAPRVTDNGQDDDIRPTAG